ncbi:unnamed protein product [marine sediment metagenome]|uniref:Uncharacterized protein n=1 Tax=marine sediment metagenome TaxID=412755 RepID=X1KN34_9ZZZZ
MKNMIYSDELGTYIGAEKTFVAMTGSPYSPLTSGRLIQLKLIVYGSAVTALIEGIIAVVTCPLWGVPVTVGTAGSGLRTATIPSVPIGIQNCDVPIQTGVDLKCEIKNVTADTPVTVEATLIGVFEG